MRRVPAACSCLPDTITHVLEHGEKRLVLVDAWLRVVAPTETIPTVKDSSANEEAERGADFSIRSLEARVLDFKVTAAQERVNNVVDPFVGEWRHVPPSMMVFLS